MQWAKLRTFRPMMGAALLAVLALFAFHLSCLDAYALTSDEAKAAKMAAATRLGLTSSTTADGIQSVETDILRVDVRDDGAMGVWRNTASVGSTPMWVQQIFGAYSKGSRFSVGGTSWGTPSGTFNMATDRTISVVRNEQVGPYTIETDFNIPFEGLSILQRVELFPGRDYYSLKWTIRNTGPSDRIGLTFIHGADTWFNNDDYGEGHWDERSNKVIVTNISGGNVTAEAGARGHMALSSPDLVTGHMEGFFGTVQAAGQLGQPTNTVEQAYHDAAYFLRWSLPLLPRGGSWTIRAQEEVRYGSSPYTVPVVLVAGYGQTWSYRSPSEQRLPGIWAERLRNRGRIVVVAPAGNGSSDWEISNHGKLGNNGWRLEQFLNGSSPDFRQDFPRGFQKVDVIGYSMGGLVAREYAARANYENGSTRIRRIVTLGTPHRGSHMAGLRSLVGGLIGDDDAASDMVAPMEDHNSRTASALNSTESPPLLIGTTPSDFVVLIGSSVYLPPQQSVYLKYPITASGHNDQFYSRPIGPAIGADDWTTNGYWTQSSPFSLPRYVSSGTPAPDVVLPYLDTGVAPSGALTVTGGGAQ